MRVKYVGPRSRVLAGKHIFHGETRDLPEKQAELLKGDPDFEFPDEVQEAQPVVSEQSHRDASQLPVISELAPEPIKSAPVRKTRKQKGKKQ